MAEEKIGKCDCLNGLLKSILWNALDERKLELWQKAADAEEGVGDSPFTACMKQARGYAGRTPEERQLRFGNIARSCAGSSRDPRDLVEGYRSEANKIDEMMNELLVLPECT